MFVVQKYFSDYIPNNARLVLYDQCEQIFFGHIVDDCVELIVTQLSG
jgi:hypothetical protein